MVTDSLCGLEIIITHKESSVDCRIMNKTREINFYIFFYYLCLALQYWILKLNCLSEDMLGGLLGKIHLVQLEMQRLRMQYT